MEAVRNGRGTAFLAGWLRAVLGGDGAAIVGALGERVEIGLGGDVVVVDVDAIVGDEDASRGAVALGIDVLAESVDGGEQGGSGLHGIFAGEERLDVGVGGLLAVFLCAGEGVRERETLGRGAGRGLRPGARKERESDWQNSRRRVANSSIGFGR